MTGVAVMILKGDQVLLGKRKGSHGEGEWSFPGGHVELGESWEKALLRELEEETGDIKISPLRYFCLANATQYIRKDPEKHYTHIGYVADWREGEPEVRDDKCEEWRWFSVYDLPSPLFAMTKYMFMSYIRGISYADKYKTELITNGYNKEEVTGYFQKVFLEK